MYEIRNANALKVGEEYLYKGVSTIYKNAVYRAVVVGLYAHIIVLSICIDKGSMEEMTLDEPKPYTWAICRNDVGKEERLFKKVG